MKNYFFIGIGGIGMSAIAQFLRSKGNIVSGSDLVKTRITQKLEDLGIKVYYFHNKANISSKIDIVVYSLAIPKDNPEIEEAKRLKITIFSRSQFLGRMMKKYGKKKIVIAGTHGKTTTTSLLTVILVEAGQDPTAIIGAEVTSLGSNVRIGNDDFFIVEACEYQCSFLDLDYSYAIITNIEPDHLDFYSDFDGVVQAFSKFSAKIPKDKVLVLYGDNKAVLNKISTQSNCKIITYGFESGNDFKIGKRHFSKDGTTFSISKKDGKKEKLKVKIPGDHNILNATACYILASELGIKKSIIKKALIRFKGAKRRFEIKGETKGVTIVDDYAHHPTEIKATLKAAKEYFKGQPACRTSKSSHSSLSLRARPSESKTVESQAGRIWAVFQPHQYSRTKFFLSDFAKSFKDADKVILLDIYASRDSQRDKKSISILDLLKAVKDNSKEAYYIGNFRKTIQFLIDNFKKGDVVFTIGAGDVWKVGEELVKGLKFPPKADQS